MESIFSTDLAVGVVLVALAAILLGGRVPFRYAVRNLRARWHTTLLMTLAFAMVVGLQTVMLAFVTCLERIVAESGRPWNVIVLSDGATDEIYSSLDRSGLRNIDLHPAVLRDGQGTPLASWEVYVVINQLIGDAAEKRNRRFIAFRGFDDAPQAAAVHGLDLHPGGTWFSRAGVQSVAAASPDAPAIQAVIGEGLARELGKCRGGEPLTIGEVFAAGPRRWVVIGILKSAGTTFDAEVWANRQQVGQTFNRERPTTLTLRAADAAAARQLAHDLSVNHKETPVNAVVESEYYSKLNDTNQQFLAAAAVVTIILCIGGTLGAMNAMFAAVAQRTQEIGVLRILGFRRRQIFASFLAEALLMAVAGGLAGCALATLADGWTTTSVLSGGQGAGASVVLRLSVDGQVLLAGMVIALGMGLIGGSPPAIAAMRLRPLAAIR